MIAAALIMLALAWIGVFNFPKIYVWVNNKGLKIDKTFKKNLKKK